MSVNSFTITKNDRLPILSRILTLVDGDSDLASSTVTFTMYDSAGTAKVSAASCTAQPGATFTVSASTDYATINAHGLQNGQEVLLSSAGTIPAPLSATTRYFVRNREPNRFQFALSPDGPIIDLTDTGTGAHTLKAVGHVTYAWAAADVDTAGTYQGWFSVTTSSKVSRWPNDSDGIAIIIEDVP